LNDPYIKVKSPRFLRPALSLAYIAKAKQM
jgi:hypothetical protein